MSTNSSINVVNEAGEVKSVYCNFDGYIEGVGKTLIEFYNDKALANELVSHGAISYIGKTIGRKHNFNSYDKKYCKFYHRDRGDDFHSNTYKNLDEALNNKIFEYNYYFINDTWFVAYDDGKLIPVKELL